MLKLVVASDPGAEICRRSLQRDLMLIRSVTLCTDRILLLSPSADILLEYEERLASATADDIPDLLVNVAELRERIDSTANPEAVYADIALLVQTCPAVWPEEYEELELGRRSGLVERVSTDERDAYLEGCTVLPVIDAPAPTADLLRVPALPHVALHELVEIKRDLDAACGVVRDSLEALVGAVDDTPLHELEVAAVMLQRQLDAHPLVRARERDEPGELYVSIDAIGPSLQLRSG